ncbi:MAG: HU family DNA-binding protein [Muribaculaceae bacterium]|nr:HU family DNA-binding protein [Muribaculaceae bacterium]
MDQILQQAAAAAGCDAAQAQSMADALAAILREKAAQMDSVAIPGFGTFVPEKVKEHVETDADTGRHMLMPPGLVLKFNPGSMLRKRLSLNE